MPRTWCVARDVAHHLVGPPLREGVEVWCVSGARGLFLVVLSIIYGGVIK